MAAAPALRTMPPMPHTVVLAMQTTKAAVVAMLDAAKQAGADVHARVMAEQVCTPVMHVYTSYIHYIHTSKHL